MNEIRLPDDESDKEHLYIWQSDSGTWIDVGEVDDTNAGDSEENSDGAE